MSQTTLRSVTLKTVANYHQAAKRAVGAYRVGGHRLLAVISRNFESAAVRNAGRFSPRLAAMLRRANDNVNGIALKGVDIVTRSTSKVIDASSTSVNSQVSRVAKIAANVDNRMVATGLQTVVRISLPGAQVAYSLSQKVADGADKLETAVSAKKKTAGKKPVVRAKATAVKAKPVKRVAAKRVAANRKVDADVMKEATKVVKAVRKGVADVQAETVAASKRVSRSVRKAIKNAPAPKVAAKQVRRSTAKAVSQAAQTVQDAVDSAVASI